MNPKNKVLKVGCYGAKGSFTYDAMEQQFGQVPREESYFPLFTDVIRAVKDGTIDYGVVPIENSSTGGITEVYDLIQRHDCAVVGEQIVKVEQNLLGLPGATLEDIDTVYSHPQGFAQCRPFFLEHRDWKQVPYFSTSRSAERVAQDGKKNQAGFHRVSPDCAYGGFYGLHPACTDWTCLLKIFSSTIPITPVSSSLQQSRKSVRNRTRLHWSFP